MSWKAEYIILIAFSTLVDYFASIEISRQKRRAIRRALLLVSLTANFGMLFAFKYFNFVSEEMRSLIATFSISFSPTLLDVLLPVGISFYTFQTVSYTIDVYNRKIKPERHLGRFALYVSFFPQLVAGPIERASNLLPQFVKKHSFQYESAMNGLKLMLWGFFLKLVIADHLSIVVDHVYGNLHIFTGWPLVLATVFFAFQIFCDFAGYSFIAIGAAQVLGFALMENFRRPYFSRSISEFWRRWHISLSTWFKDYLYIPLGGNKVGIPRWYFNLFIVFLVSGIWHGANWTFLVWGALHGVYIVGGQITAPFRKWLHSRMGLYLVPRLFIALQVFTTFTLVLVSWVFFRAESLSDAWYVLRNWYLPMDSSGVYLGVSVIALFGAVGFIILMELVHFLQETGKINGISLNAATAVRWCVYGALALLVLLFGSFHTKSFIYFAF